MRPCLLYVKHFFFGYTEHMVQSIARKVSVNIQREITILPVRSPAHFVICFFKMYSEYFIAQ